MNWGAIGAVAEILSAVVVSITVIYLAFQTRSTRELVARATSQTIADTYGRFQSAIVSDKEVADIWLRGTMDLNSLDDTEKTRFIWLWSMYTNPIRTMWNAGNRQEENYRTWASILDRPGARQIFEERSNGLPQELNDYIQSFTDGT